MKVSVHLCVSKTQRALSLLQLRDDKSSGADGERQHQETSPSQVCEGGASRRSTGEGARGLLELQGGIPDFKRNTLVKWYPQFTSLPP